MSTIVPPDSIVNYVSGCVSRERQRIAKIMQQANVDQKTIDALLDTSQDEDVFRWAPPTAKLGDPMQEKHKVTVHH